MCQRKTKQMREFEPILKANGYREISSNGSHFIYSKGTNQITVNKDLNKMVRKRLIKENVKSVEKLILVMNVQRRMIKMCQRKTKQMREFEPILKANGYREIRSNGSHFIYSNGTNQITVNKDLNKMVRKRLIKENNLIER